MATKLNQILALEADAKRHATVAVATADRNLLSEKAPLHGYEKTYVPDEGQEPVPPESVKVQHTAQDVLDTLRQELVRVFDLTATKDFTNTEARANVVVDGNVLVADVPTTYLLYLEKQLGELESFINRVPTLDPAKQWNDSATQGLHATDPVETFRTAQVFRNHVLDPGSKEHPAQVHMYTENVHVGRYSQIWYSGALTVPEKRQMQTAVRTLKAAVKTAREEANTRDVQDKKVGATILNYIFGNGKSPKVTF